jgi:hypothetical protein
VIIGSGANSKIVRRGARAILSSLRRTTLISLGQDRSI